MGYSIHKVLHGYRPLYCLTDGLILLRGHSLYRSDIDLTHFERICDLPHETTIGRLPIRILARILRVGADAAALIDDNNLLVAQRGTIYRVSLKTNTWTKDLVVPGGSRALYLSTIRDPSSGERAICFGEYSTLFDGGAIHVWRRGVAADAPWEISGTFPPGEIDHVHNIYQDSHGRIFILTGDFGSAAGIWTSDFALSCFRPLLRGSQNVRACWLWQQSDGDTYFATDSQFEPNYLRVIRDGVAADVEPILGSSIHFYADTSRLIFSTAVEPGALTGHRIADILDRKRGPGILSDEAALYELMPGGALREIYRDKKDGWPMRLAQFGTFKLPGGTMPPDRIYAYGVALKNSDGRCLLFKR